MSEDADTQVYLRSYLAPLRAFLDRPDVTDLYVNRPGEVWIETLGGAAERHSAEGLTGEVLDRLSRQIAAHAHQGVNREHPLLSAALPGGERIQIILPPATRGEIAIAIRKQVASDMALSDYVAAGAFPKPASNGADTDIAQHLKTLHEAGDYAGLLAAAVRGRRNILISGGTSTGKTTFLNALLREIPAEERLILIEDAPELILRHENAIGLLAPRGALGASTATAEDLLNASLRMRPDRIIVGELRGPEAFTFLRAVNTGHPGSMTTIHADSPERAIEQIALLVLQGGTTLSRADVLHYVQSTIDVFIHLGRVGGSRSVESIVVRRTAVETDG
ncbi:P-type DNA transfer ATPase VirB11 [Brevundimonas kwangchunensis]|uniref:Type IV secretion system protein n=1 Tax=Brevundimonas kwangchunensis TaxID=322163 RepID=A0ABN1GXD4_9CAUL